MSFEPFPLHQTNLSNSPEVFNTIDMNLISYKLIVTMLDCLMKK